MAAFGVTPQGYVRKRLADIKAEIEASLRLTFGVAINVLPASVFGQLVGVIADREASVWETAEDNYNSQYPATAAGVSLDNVLSISGLTRMGATKSKVLNQLLFGTAGTIVPAGTLFSVVSSPTSQFQTLTSTTLAAGADEVQQIVFSATPASGTWAVTFNASTTTALAFNAAAAAVQTALRLLPGLDAATVSGNYATGFVVTFAGNAGKQNQPSLVVASSLFSSVPGAVVATVSTTTAGVAQGIVNLEALSTGPTTAPTGTLSNIDTPVSGLSRTINTEDATVGNNIETDDEARVRRSKTLQVAGAGTPSAIRSRLLALADVQDAIVFENVNKIPDLAGRPASSFEVVVAGGDAVEIGKTVFISKPAGIETVGNQTSTVVDSRGTSQTVKWSRPTFVPIFISLDLTTNASFPANGAAVAKQLVLDYGNALGLDGDVVVYPQLIAALSSVPGIVDITVRVAKTAVSTTTGAAAVDDNIVIASNEISQWDTSRVSINVI